MPPDIGEVPQDSLGIIQIAGKFRIVGLIVFGVDSVYHVRPLAAVPDPHGVVPGGQRPDLGLSVCGIIDVPGIPILAAASTFWYYLH